MFGDLREIHVSRERHGAGVNPENLQPRLGIGNANFNFAIEAAWTPQRRVEDLGDVGGPDHNDLPARDKSIHQTEKLRHHAFLNLADHLGAFGSDSVNLVDKQDRGSVARGFFENLADLGLALAVELPHNLRAVEMNKVHATFGGYGAGQQSFPRARGAV